ncbi:MAG: 4Fe-4S ferredoxin [Gammaproteobacteria bacterium]|nr:MAG: 4Fe-4S ferredoxin [Gammaproteobacteria bacterium]
MFDELIVFFIYAVPLILIIGYYFFCKKKEHCASENFLLQAQKDKLTQPASIHPVVDHAKCFGCGSCLSACPEKNVLGLIDQKAHLINPTNCIGHGACKASCPYDAITLVFGTAKRGVDIPEITPDFQTTVSGLFIAGELGGMGLIKNAIEQGKQAMYSIDKFLKTKSSKKSTDTAAQDVDCVIVGAGPAGISATLAAKELNRSVVTIDQETIGGTVSHFPRGKLVMTSPAHLPLHGAVKFSETTKEKLLTFWLDLIEKYSLKINQNEAMIDIVGNDDGSFTLQSSKKKYHTKTILLSIGRRGTPRKLNVKGEDLPKVVYRLIDPQQYKNEDVLVIGGGDSALEAACSIAELTDCKVSLSYRNDNFNRAKQKNRERVDLLVKNGDLTLYFSSQVAEIIKDEVILSIQDEQISIQNSVVIICAGGVLPTPFLKKLGIEVTTKYGTL